MQPVFAIATNITTSLGLKTADVWNAVMAGNTGIRQHNVPELSATPFWASRIADAQWLAINASIENNQDYTPFEIMAIYSVMEALAQCTISKEETVLILATTKGNIEGLNEDKDERNLLTTSAGIIAKAVGLSTNTIVVSHACVSGVTALQYGLALLQNDRYKNAIVVGADRFTKFVLSGFQSFQAVADEPCKPFDANRKGINLGEAAATIILSTSNQQPPLAVLCAGATSNDANHISGPSRTGSELAMAIQRTLQQGDVTPEQVDMISAHGTATVYNDEMESKAFAVAGLLHSEVNSIKGYLGHTLGAAGVLESILCIQAIQQQTLIASAGFETLGVPENIKVTTKAIVKKLNYVLKTASGFGGCNAVVLWARP